MAEFQGSKVLSTWYSKLAGSTEALTETYKQGLCLSFQGGHGQGKTMTVCNILKRVAESGKYVGLYVTLRDILNTAVFHSSYEVKSDAWAWLLGCDFLVIDEFDPRFAANDSGIDLFGRVLEDVFRPRSQNSLPFFICSNSPKELNQLIPNEMVRASLASLMNYVTPVQLPPMKDFRKEKK